MRGSLPNTGGQLASFRLCIREKNGQAAIGGADLPFQAKGLDQMHDSLCCHPHHARAISPAQPLSWLPC